MDGYLSRLSALGAPVLGTLSLISNKMIVEIEMGWVSTLEPREC